MAESAKQPGAPPWAQVLSISPPCAPVEPNGSGAEGEASASYLRDRCLSLTISGPKAGGSTRLDLGTFMAYWEAPPLASQIWGSLLGLGLGIWREHGVGASSGLDAW